MNETKTYSYVVQGCPICHDSLAEFDADENCQSCGSSARLRSLVPVVDQYLGKMMVELRNTDLPLLGVAMTATERKILESVFKNFKSVSLFGSYSSDHEMGVDIRDLSRYESNSFSGVFGCGIFDYFMEHELALQECFRVTAPGGLFLTHVSPRRVVDGDVPPYLKSMIKPRVGYLEYVPSHIEIPSIKVGRDWFVNSMRGGGGGGEISTCNPKG